MLTALPGPLHALPAYPAAIEYPRPSTLLSFPNLHERQRCAKASFWLAAAYIDDCLSGSALSASGPESVDLSISLGLDTRYCC